MGRHGAAASGRARDELGYAALRGGEVAGEHTVFLFGEAERLELTHPETGARVRLESPLPVELVDVLRRAGIAPPASITAPPNFPAANSSAWPSRAPSPTGRCCCLRMNPPEILIRGLPPMYTANSCG